MPNATAGFSTPFVACAAHDTPSVSDPPMTIPLMTDGTRPSTTAAIPNREHQGAKCLGHPYVDAVADDQLRRGREQESPGEQRGTGASELGDDVRGGFR